MTTRNKVPWKEFRLEATLGDTTESQRIIGQATYSAMKVADGNEKDAIHFDAVTDAVMTIMNRASRSRVWAKGSIKLIDPETGEVLHEMEEKGEGE